MGGISVSMPPVLGTTGLWVSVSLPVGSQGEGMSCLLCKGVDLVNEEWVILNHYEY